MNYGYIGFSFSKNIWYDKIIAKVTKSKWSHSFITIPSILGREMVMESVANGVCMIPFDFAYRDNPHQDYRVYRFKIHKDNIDTSISLCMNQLETAYGWLEYPWFLWRAICAVFGKDIKAQNNWSPQGTVCSGLVRFFIENAGCDLFREFGIDSANAQDIYEVVLTHPELFELIEEKNG